jgi:Peptidase family M23
LHFVIGILTFIQVRTHPQGEGVMVFKRTHAFRLIRSTVVAALSVGAACLQFTPAHAAKAPSVFTGTTPKIVEKAVRQALTPAKSCTGNETVLLIQDVTPWAAAPGGSADGAVVDELTAQQKNWCAIGSTQIVTANLTKIKTILIAAAQTQTFYDNLFPSTPTGRVIHSAITNWVKSGGILIANLADCASGPGSGGAWASSACNADVNTSYTFVGGLKHVNVFSDSNDIGTSFGVSSHPIVAGGMPCPTRTGGNCGKVVDTGQYTDLDGWGYSSHGIFVNLPAGATVVIKESTLFAPAAVTVDYPVELGRVIATMTTTEYRYVGGFGSLPRSRKLLANEIAFGFMASPLACGDPHCKFQYTRGVYTSGIVNSVLDHSLKHNSSSTFWQYLTVLDGGGDGVIVGFTGETANGGQASKDVTCVFGIVSLYGLNNNSDCTKYGNSVSYDEHPGYDYKAAKGTPVMAVAAGTVVTSASGERCYKTYTYNNPKSCDSWGWVGIDHGNGYISQYGHLSEIRVTAGQTNIAKGQVIGLSGDTAPIKLAPHLHFEVLKRMDGALLMDQVPIMFVDPYGWAGANSDPLYCPNPADATNCLQNRPLSWRLWE